MATGSTSTHYQILGVPPGATHEEIATRFRDLARVAHPDAGGSAEAFTPLAAAWAVLSDSDQRKAYDRELRFTRVPCPYCAGSGIKRAFVSYGQGIKHTCQKCAGVGFEPPLKKSKI